MSVSHAMNKANISETVYEWRDVMQLPVRAGYVGAEIVYTLLCVIEMYQVQRVRLSLRPDKS